MDPEDNGDLKQGEGNTSVDAAEDDDQSEEHPESPGDDSVMPPAFTAREPSMVPPKPFPPRVVGDIMTREVIAIETQATLDRIERGMQRYKFRHLPVVDAEHKLVGLVSHRDLMHAESSTLSADREKRDAIIRERATVNQIMHHEVISVKRGTALDAAAELMLHHQIGCLPIVKDDNTLVGIVTRSDLVRLAVEFLKRD